MVDCLAGNPKEVRVMGHDDSPSDAGKLQVVLIGASA